MKKRFIAGVVCPKCGALDTIMAVNDTEQQVLIRDCIDCGFTDRPQADPTALSIGDLKGLMSIIDVASARGSFRAGEMAGVGTLYNKLSAFLAKVAPTEGQPGAVGSEAPKEK